ncbi:MAG: hypothetical protein IKT51_05735 [Phascolarctobacterium sp.]|nr:hypothetical protein [Phascolarctobacterium sp.]
MLIVIVSTISKTALKNTPERSQECFFFDLSIKLWIMLPVSVKTACGETRRGKTTSGFFTRGNSTDGIFICGDLPKSDFRTMVKKLYSYIPFALGGNSAAVSVFNEETARQKPKKGKS